MTSITISILYIYSYICTFTYVYVHILCWVANALPLRCSVPCSFSHSLTCPPWQSQKLLKDGLGRGSPRTMRGFFGQSRRWRWMKLSQLHSERNDLVSLIEPFYWFSFISYHIVFHIESINCQHDIELGCRALWLYRFDSVDSVMNWESSRLKS